MWHDMNGWWMVWGTVMMLVFWGGIIALGVWAGRSLLPGRGGSPLDIARERYARGEIGQEEFEEIRQALVSGTR